MMPLDEKISADELKPHGDGRRSRSSSNSSLASALSDISELSVQSGDSYLLPIPCGIRRSRSTDDDDESSSSRNSSLDFSLLELTSVQLQAQLLEKCAFSECLVSLNLSSNNLEWIPQQVGQLVNLKTLDLSQNQLSSLDEAIVGKLTKLTTLMASNNNLSEESIPKNFSSALGQCLNVLALGGNDFKRIPQQIYEMSALKSLFFGSNRIQYISKKIRNLNKLQNLYLGGNNLMEIPYEVGLLQNLQSLSLCENKLTELPSSIAYLRSLKSLALHNNELTALPPEIVKLRSLIALSLRNNPLVVRFVRDMVYEVPSLLELAGRVIKTNKITFTQTELPRQVMEYLEHAQRCVNPKCKGVYFDARVEHIKFVDFCGIYRIPLLQYLCSPQCTSTNPANLAQSSSEDENNDYNVAEQKLKRVLLGNID